MSRFKWTYRNSYRNIRQTFISGLSEFIECMLNKDLHGKNGFYKVANNFSRYRSENNFIKIITIKIITYSEKKKILMYKQEELQTKRIMIAYESKF